MLEAEHYIDVVQHIQRYATHTLHKVAKVDSDFRRLHPKYRALVPTFDAKMRRIRECIATNQLFVRKIVEERGAFMQPGIDYDALFAREGPVNEERMSKVTTRYPFLSGWWLMPCSCLPYLPTLCAVFSTFRLPCLSHCPALLWFSF